ncbi:MAG: thiol:disulfide interchange protein DsbA/DsbL [Betaproteobacteria bacterium]|nr:MAG: thiol:disulfide interchange protein DsbA/DsbL [Betaproteobacteria bacterium]
MRKIFALITAMVLGLPLAAAAQSFQYTELKPPQALESKGKVEVIEFFWYGCIHCYNLEPYIEAWEKKLPKDVEFKRVPAVFSPRWGYDASVFYTFEALGVLDKLHRPLFDAIHKDRLRTDDPQAMGEWLQKHGVDPKKFNDTMKSFGVQSKTRRATQLTVAYKIDGTPAMAVNGRYTVSAEQGRTQQGMLKTVDGLVEMERKQK